LTAEVARQAGLGAAFVVGVGMPGSLSTRTGLVRNANSTWLNGRSFVQDLTTRLGKPVRAANDANCFALSEATDGAGSGASSIFGVIIGTGCGGGLVIGGRLVEGVNGVAGEWGHMPLPWPAAEEAPGPECWCGKRGCLETFVSGPAFEADFTDRVGGHRRAAEIAVLADQGDAQACSALNRLAHRLARGLAGVINIADPETIVLGGGLSNIAALPAMIAERLPDFVFSDHVATRIVKNHHGDSSGVRGAAWLWRADEC
jgi:fructokinase